MSNHSVVAEHSAQSGQVAASRRPAILVALAFAAVVAGCSLSPPAALTDDEWSWCQGHWRDGLDAAQRNEPDGGGGWYFNHMGMRDDPETIRVCRVAAAQHQP